MNNNLSNDSLATILICSTIGMDVKNESIHPYTLKQWNDLSDRLINSEMKRPASFFRTEEKDWKEQLRISDKEVERLKILLGRAGQVGIEMESLNSIGIFVTTRAEQNYPKRIKEILKRNSPPVLYYCGELEVLKSEGIGIVGSRDIDENGLNFTKTLVQKCVSQGYAIISGGARGVDTAAQNEALLNKDGKAVSILADSMIQKIKQKEIREAISKGKLLLISPFHPKSVFTVYNAMDRNKYIYILSKCTVAVSSDYNKGGTWAGASENLKNNWVPLLVRKEDNAPKGNTYLIEAGGKPLSAKELASNNFSIESYINQISESKKQSIYQTEQISLFSYIREDSES